MTTAYPTALDAFVNPSSGDTTTEVPHAAQHSNANDAIEALEAKVGIGSSTPVAGNVLTGDDTGSSAWMLPWAVDVKAFGAVGDGVTDDTQAIQDAIDYVSRPVGDTIFAVGSTAVDFTLSVWVDGVSMGTTGTIAAAASNSTIQTALELLVGSGNVTVATTTEKRVTFPRALGHVMLLSSYFTAYPAGGPIIYPRPGSAGMGGDVYGHGLFRITDTIRVYTDNVRLWFGRGSPGFFPGTGIEASRSGNYGNGLIWGGDDEGGPMVSIQAVGLPALTGVGFSGTLIAGDYPFTTAANTGLFLSGVTASRFDHIHTVEFKADGLLLTTDLANRGGQYLERGVAYCTFGFVGSRQWVNSGNGIRFSGDSSSSSYPYGQNVYANTFDTVYLYYRNGHGAVFEDNDSNWFRNWSGIPHPTASVLITTSAAADDTIDTTSTHGFSAGDIVRFVKLTGGSGLSEIKPYYVIASGLTTTSFKVSTTLGGSAVDFTTDITDGIVTRGVGILHRALSAGGSRNNVWDQCMPGRGGFLAEGSDMDTVVPHTIDIRHYFPNTGHHSSPQTPTVGPDADVTWRNLRSTVSDYGSGPPAMAGLTFPW